MNGTKRWALLACCLIAGSASTQTKDAGQALHDVLMNKQLFPRGFNARTEIRWRWNGTSLVQDVVLVHTVGAMTATSVEVKDDKVEIVGERQTLLHGSDGRYHLSRVKDHVRVKVDLAGADKNGLLSRLPGLLFYPNAESMVADIPGEYRDILPATPAEGKVSSEATQKCDCADSSAACMSEGSFIGNIGLMPPKERSHTTPILTNEAREARFHDHVTVHAKVDEHGRVRDVWIVKPGGFGMDEVVGEAIIHSVFLPATCHGSPVTVPMLTAVEIEGPP